MTQEFLQDAIVEDLEQLFSHYTLTNSLGVNRKIQVFSQFLPFREGDDEETDAEAPPETRIASVAIGPSSRTPAPQTLT